MDEEARKNGAAEPSSSPGSGGEAPPKPGERRKEPRLEEERQGEEAGARPEERQPDKGKGGAAKGRMKRIFGSRKVQVALGLTVLAVALLFWWYSSLWESTDDAQIDGHLNQVSARVAGQVTKVRFEDNQFVRAGSVLVEIDPTDYQVALERARAELAEATAAAEGARVGVPITSVDTANQVATARARVANARAGIVAASRQHAAARARVDEARAQSVKYQSDLRRYGPLAAKDIISRQQYDQALAQAQSAAASVAAADATMRAAAQQVTQARGQRAQAEAELRTAQTAPQQVRVARTRSASAEAALQRARSALRQAELNLQYTQVVAPVDGITGRKSVEPGQNVMPGQNLLFLVPVQDIWVTANFKEDQLRQIRPGQRATISVDAYDRSYEGYVETIGAASGARFSLFPPENATGNYVKVVQRIPVRLRFDRGQDPEHLLRPGMSVVPKVRVQ